MDFDFQWLLLGLPIAFALGWVASRLDVRQWKRELRESPRAYFKGLNLLLNEQQDKAIDAFIEAVQHDPDTSELHFALGNLFRRRGEFERAVRVHEHLLNRADLPAADRERAQHALAQDFMKAGLFDRAEQAYQALEGTPFETEARLALLSLYERSRDWHAAVDTAGKLEKIGAGSFGSRIAHYWCELALEADERGSADEADAALRHALQASPQSARALLLIGQRHARAGRDAQALQAWNELRNRNPLALRLVAREYAQTARKLGEQANALAALTALNERHPSMDLLQAIALLDDDRHAHQQRVAAYLAQQPSLAAAGEVLRTPPSSWSETALHGVRAAIDHAAEPLQRYRCAACGFEAQHYFWQCPGCLNWDSYPTLRVEEL